MPSQTDASSASDNPPSLQDQLNALIQLATTFNNRFDTFVTHMTTQSALNNIATLIRALNPNLQHNQPPPPTPPPPPLPPNPANHQPRLPKITLPIFNWSNPFDWILQANNYFQYYNIPLDQRTNLSVFYFTDDALSSYKHQENNHLLGTWDEFSRALELRFGPSTFENHQLTLFKLRQANIVTAYHAEFAESVIVSQDLPWKPCSTTFCQASARHPNELAIHDPTSLNQAYGLTKLVEDKFNLTKP